MSKVLEQLQNPTMGNNNQQRINNSRGTTLEWTAAKATGGLNSFCWYQIVALDHIFVEAQTILSSQGGFLTIVIYHRREQIESNLHNMMKQAWKRTHDSQIVRAKENLKLINGGPSYRHAPITYQQIKALRQSRH